MPGRFVERVLLLLGAIRRGRAGGRLMARRAFGMAGPRGVLVLVSRRVFGGALGRTLLHLVSGGVFGGTRCLRVALRKRRGREQHGRNGNQCLKHWSLLLQVTRKTFRPRRCSTFSRLR